MNDERIATFYELENILIVKRTSSGNKNRSTRYTLNLSLRDKRLIPLGQTPHYDEAIFVADDIAEFTQAKIIVTDDPKQYLFVIGN